MDIVSRSVEMVKGVMGVEVQSSGVFALEIERALVNACSAVFAVPGEH